MTESTSERIPPRFAISVGNFSEKAFFGPFFEKCLKKQLFLKKFPQKLQIEGGMRSEVDSVILQCSSGRFRTLKQL